MFRRFLVFLAKILGKFLYRVEFIDRDKLPLEGPALIAANHQHAFDIVFLHVMCKPWINWISKKEFTEMKVFGPIIKKLDVIPVDRDKSDLMTAKLTLNALRSGKVVGIFPQGTRMKSLEQIYTTPPKSGTAHFAVKTNTPIYPVGIKGDFKLFRKMKVIAGDPIYPDQLKELFTGKNAYQDMSNYLMEKIYALTGFEYRLDLPASSEDKPTKDAIDTDSVKTPEKMKKKGDK